MLISVALRRLLPTGHLSGWVTGAVFFWMSLTPSLLPRSWMLQGILCGTAFAMGFGTGSAAASLWRWLQLPSASLTGPSGQRVRHGIMAAAGLFMVTGLWLAAGWQNSIRSLMELPPVDSSHPVKTGLTALICAVLLFALARLFRLLLLLTFRQLRRFLPPRVAGGLGALTTVILFWTLLNGVLFRAGLRIADSSLQQLDEMNDPAFSPPVAPAKTGSPASLIGWESLGRRGREFVAAGPDAAAITALTGSPALEPVRVYAGLRSAETPEARAGLALEELKRTGGFARPVLLIIIPTGTGWVDPQAIDTVEFLHHGNIASVAVQYSYLSSWLSLLVNPEYGQETAKALFSAIYGHWITLPKSSRPRLYLHGLSLGALNSQESADLYDVIADPFSGALWSGPPFAGEQWRTLTAGRVPSSPAWLPRFRDSSVIRFANQNGVDAPPGAVWGPLRIVYLQHASDPITFISPSVLYREPDWMRNPRGPDVSPQLRWFPLVTFLQLGVDAAQASHSPVGHGHVYAPEDYINAWREVTAPDHWTPDSIARLKEHFRTRRKAEPAP